MRLILDVMVVVGAVRRSPGGRALYDAALERRFGVVSSTAVSEEYRRVVLRPEIRGAMSPDAAARIIDALDAISEMVHPVPPFSGPLPDENDRHLVSLARHAALPIVPNDTDGFPAALVDTLTIADALRALELRGLLA